MIVGNTHIKRKMPFLLRSFLFVLLVGTLLIANPLRAETLPPLPRPNVQNVQNAELNALGNLMSGSRGVAHPQSNSAETSIQTAHHEDRFETLSPPNIRQAAASQEFFNPSRHSTFDDDDYYYDPMEEFCVEEEERRVREATEAYNAILDRGMFSSRGRGEEDDEMSTGGWLDGIAKPNITPLLSIGGSLCIVLGAFFLLAVFLRKVSPQGNRPLPKEAFECLGRYYITQKQQLQVLRLGNRIVLVSVMPDSISTLAEITDPDETVAFLGLCRRLDTNSATEVFRKTVASMSEEELTRPHSRPAVSQQRSHRAASLDLYSDPEESLASMLSRGGRYGR